MTLWEPWFSLGKKKLNFCPSHLQRKGKDKTPKSSENAKKMLFTMLYTQDWKSCQSSSCLRQVSFVNYCINKFTALLGPCQCITETIKFLLSCMMNSCFRISFSPQNLTFATKNKLVFFHLMIAMFFLFFWFCASANFCWNNQNNNNTNKIIHILVTCNSNSTKDLWSSVGNKCYQPT